MQGPFITLIHTEGDDDMPRLRIGTQDGQLAIEYSELDDGIDSQPTFQHTFIIDNETKSRLLDLMGVM
jgi:hypothetical protein